MAAIQAAFQARSVLFPAGTTITVPASGDTINDTTGALIGGWSVASTNTATMDGSPAAAAGVGACITWTTGGIVPGKKGPRRLRGRTFLVPLSTSTYESNGTLTSGALTGLQALADALKASGPLGIWHRPSSLTAADGNSYGVQSARVRDKVAYLSSRRD